jgi:hypothetical protein
VLRSGRDLHLALPVRGQRRTQMRAFTPDTTKLAADGIRWRPAPGPDPLEVVRARPPQYAPGLALLENTIRARMGFSPDLARQLLERMPLADRRAQRKEWSESGRVLRYTKTLKHGLDVVTIPFDVAENGTVSNWGESSGYHSILYNALQEVAPALPGPWRAGTCAGRTTAMRARLQVLCFDDGTVDIEIRADPDDWSPCEAPARAQFVMSSEAAVTAPPVKTAVADTEKNAVATAANTASPEVLGSRYLLDAASLGWISCLRPAETRGGRVTYTFAAGAADAEVRLVFRKTRAIVAGTMRGADVQFQNVPSREQVTIVALRYDEKGKPALAIQAAVIGEPLAAPLVYKTLTIAELRAALAQLDVVE